MNRIYRADDFVGGLGFEAYRVGGSVRDEIIGRKPKDADYVVRGIGLTDLGRELMRRDCKISPIVARDKATLGWRTAIKGVGLVEIVLPRTERSTGNGRDMDIFVSPDLSLADDSKRRDFTFNALYKGVGEGYPAAAVEGGVIDPTGYGLHDLRHRIVRVPHVNSFSDDPLRMLRGLRFISTLNADLDGVTEVLMATDHEHVHGLTADGHTSGTVFEEFSKLLMGQAPAKALRIARDTGVLEVALPEVASILNHDPDSRYHDMSTDEHTFKALETAAHVDAPLRVRWSLLFHDTGKKDVEFVGADGKKHFYAAYENGMRDHAVASAERWAKAAARMNVPKALRNDVLKIVLHHMVPTQTRNPGGRIRRMRVEFGDSLLRDLLLHRTCDLSGKRGKVAQNHIQHIAKLERLRMDAVEAGIPASVKELQVGGKDAIAAGLEGVDIGRALSDILDDVVVDPSPLKLSREWQLRRLG